MSLIAERLIDWHRDHGRHDLPWQNTRDPYRIWLSEIMLQQTQVDTVIPYYQRFLEHFPDLATLAAAPLDAVLACWSGLGYYARARNLHKAARVVVDEHGGRFPERAPDIMTLPGIGRSTAAAIAVFAFEARAAILDGNVKRVLCRAFGIDGFPGDKAIETRLWILAEALLPATGAAIYIQAQMDLGATLCTRTRPDCGRCPLAADCVALRDGRVTELPGARPKKAIPHRRIHVAVIRAGESVLLERRPPAGIWGGLLALPEIADDHGDGHAWLSAHFGLTARSTTALEPVKHALTHFRLEIVPLLFDVTPQLHRPAEGASEQRSPPNRPARVHALAEAHHTWLSLDRLDHAGLPAPVRRILDSLAPAAPLSSPDRAERDKHG